MLANYIEESLNVSIAEEIVRIQSFDLGRFATKAALTAGLINKSDAAHNHSLANLTEKSYNSLTDRPEIPSIVGLATTGELSTSIQSIISLIESDYAPVIHGHSYNDLADKPSLFSGSYNDLSNKPALFSGSYTDLNNKPSLFSGSWNDLADKPTIPPAYSLPVATAEILGGIKIGARLSILDGVLSADIQSQDLSGYALTDHNHSGTYLENLNGALLATGAATGATAQAQVFSKGILLGAGSESITPFQLSSGSLNTTPKNGAIEYYNGTFYLQKDALYCTSTANNFFAGSVGIGVVPAYKFHCSTTDSNGYYFECSTASGQSSINVKADVPKIYLAQFGTTAANTFAGITAKGLAINECQSATNYLFSTWGDGGAYSGNTTPAFIWAPRRVEKMRLTEEGNLGINVPNPQARLHLPPGSVSFGKSPIKFSNGPLVSSKEDGTIEYFSNMFYLQKDDLCIGSRSAVGGGTRQLLVTSNYGGNTNYDYGDARFAALTSGNGTFISANVKTDFTHDDTIRSGQAIIMGAGYSGIVFKNYASGAGVITPTTLMTIAETGNITIGVGSLLFANGSKGIVLKQAANGKCGTFTANNTTPVTVSNTSIAITDVIMFGLNTVGGTPGAYPVIQTITASTGFTVACTAGDTSVYNYCVISKAA